MKLMYALPEIRALIETVRALYADRQRLNWLEMTIRNSEVVEFGAMPYGASGNDVEEIEMIVAHDGHCEIRAKLRTILDYARGVHA